MSYTARQLYDDAHNPRESPMDPHRPHSSGNTLWSRSARPVTELEALMVCSPNQEPLPSQLERRELYEVVATAIETVLDDRERDVFDSITVERVSVREVGRRLNLAKSYVHRIHQGACAKLAEHLGSDPIIQAHLGTITPQEESHVP